MNAPDDTLVPIPPRYWWLKRIFLALAVLVLALGVLRWWWGVQAEHRWRECLARLEATGEPLYAKDFVQPAVPDEENAVHFLNIAIGALKRDPQGANWAELADRAARGDASADTAGPLAANEESLRAIRAACAAPSVEWGFDYSHGIAGVQFHPNPCDVIPAAQLAYMASMEALRDGDQRSVLEGVACLLRLTWVMHHHRALLGHFSGCETARLAVRLIERGAPTLTVGDGSSTAPSRAEVEDLIQRLLDETDARESWRMSWLHERALQLELMRGVAEARVGMADVIRPSVAALLAPAFKLDAVKIMAFNDRLIAVSVAQNAIAARAQYPSMPDSDRKLDRYGRLLSAFLLPSYFGLSDEQFKHLALRRLAATRLALRLYELDHGALPETLAELVPTYLPAVPVDPLFDDDRPIGYQPAGPEKGLFAGPLCDPNDPSMKRRSPRDSALARYPVAVALDADLVAPRSPASRSSAHGVEDNCDVEGQRRQTDQQESAHQQGD